MKEGIWSSLQIHSLNLEDKVPLEKEKMLDHKMFTSAYQQKQVWIKICLEMSLQELTIFDERWSSMFQICPLNSLC